MAMLIAFEVFAVVLLAYAGLTPIGHWQDEFATLPLTLQGWKPFLVRLLTWSPRPVSESLIFAYGHLVDHFRAPLIGSSLLFLWGVLGLCMIAVPLWLRKRLPSGMAMWQCVAISLATYCLFLVGHPVSEMFYWPLAAFAYLPTMGALSVAMWAMVMTDLNSRGRWLVAAALVVAAWSSEVGAMLVFVFSGLTIAYRITWRLARIDFSLPARAGLWIAVPLVAAGAVLGILRLVRVGNPNEIFGDPTVAHHIQPAVELAVYRFFDEIITWGSAVQSLDGRLEGGGTKLAFMLGVYGILRPVFAHAQRRAVPMLLLFGLACLTTVLLTIAAAYYEFGLVCCERHETFRQSVIFLGLSSIAAFLASIPVRRNSAAYGAPWYVACLAIAVAIPAYTSAPAVINDYRDYADHFRVKNTNWAVGMAPGESMVFLQMERGQIIGGVPQPDATHTMTSNSGWWVEAIMTYFKKQSVTFQTEK
ncbi:hypothetical protein [Cupriavidus campinensis]